MALSTNRRKIWKQGLVHFYFLFYIFYFRFNFPTFRVFKLAQKTSRIWKLDYFGYLFMPQMWSIHEEYGICYSQHKWICTIHISIFYAKMFIFFTVMRFVSRISKIRSTRFKFMFSSNSSPKMEGIHEETKKCLGAIFQKMATFERSPRDL
jgi:hypothetical protein